MSAPILVVGMHRSGTGLLVNLLEGLGVHMGWIKERNEEAVLFFLLNRWLLRQAGGAWDHPEPFTELLDDVPAREAIVSYLDSVLRTPWSISYLGPLSYLRWRTPARRPGVWGFKDPRTTFTLPIWEDLFGPVKVVHLYRHGVDVAESVRSRTDRILSRERSRHHLRSPMTWFWPTGRRFRNTFRAADLDSAFQLWERYMLTARGHADVLGERYHEIAYEELLADPARHLDELAAFCGTPAASGLCARLGATIRSDRAFAYRDRPELRRFAETKTSELASYGYEP